jgi:hypothetical protein
MTGTLAVWATHPRLATARDIVIGLVAFVLAVGGSAADPAATLTVLAILWAAGNLVAAAQITPHPAPVARRVAVPAAERAAPRALAGDTGHHAAVSEGWRRRGAPTTGRSATGVRTAHHTPARAAAVGPHTHEPGRVTA